jgi:hypothetical protein
MEAKSRFDDGGDGRASAAASKTVGEAEGAAP